MKQEIIIGTNTLLAMGEQLYLKGEISLEQYHIMRNRSKPIPEEWKKDLIVVGE